MFGKRRIPSVPDLDEAQDMTGDMPNRENSPLKALHKGRHCPIPSFRRYILDTFTAEPELSLDP